MKNFIKNLKILFKGLNIFIVRKIYTYLSENPQIVADFISRMKIPISPTISTITTTFQTVLETSSKRNIIWTIRPPSANFPGKLTLQVGSENTQRKRAARGKQKYSAIESLDKKKLKQLACIASNGLGCPRVGEGLWEILGWNPTKKNQTSLINDYKNNMKTELKKHKQIIEISKKKAGWSWIRFCSSNYSNKITSQCLNVGSLVHQWDRVRSNKQAGSG